MDQSISIVSFGFPAPDVDDAAYDVALQVQVQGSSIIIAQTNQSLVVKRRSIICVKVDKPVRVDPNIVYKVVYKLKVEINILCTLMQYARQNHFLLCAQIFFYLFPGT